jgi:hypothetical protein
MRGLVGDSVRFRGLNAAMMSGDICQLGSLGPAHWAPPTGPRLLMVTYIHTSTDI